MIDRIVNYLKGVRAEVARVSWPTRTELVSLTVLIIILMVIMTVYIWGVDGMLATLLKVFIRSG